MGGFTVLLEPDGETSLRSSTISGVDVPPIVVPLAGLATGSVIAYKSGQRLYVPDTGDNLLVSQRLVEATGAASMLFEPVRREGQVIGVLCVGFLTARPTLGAAATAIIELITQLLASLITRVDLLTRLEALAADASDMVGRYELTNEGFRFRYASPSAYALLGRRPEALIGTSPRDLVHPDDLGALAPIPAALLSGEPVTTVYRAAHADGRWVWLETTVRPIVDPATGLVTEVQATSRDISDRKQIEDELRDAHDLFAGLLDAATEYSIIGTDPDGLITVFNGGAERLLGYPAAEMIGHATPAIIHDPAEIAQRAAELGVEPGLEALIAWARQGHVDSREWTYVTRDGRRIHVALTVTAMRDQHHGRLTGFIGIAHDLAERDATVKQLNDAYLRELAMVRQLKDLATARDDFVSAVTHDLRTPLTSIRGYAEILTHTADALPPPQRKMLAVIDRNSERLLRLVDDLLTMARMEAGKLHLIMAPVNATALIGDVCRDFEPEARRRRLTFEIATHPDLGTILVDARHIERVLSNLVSNAIKFTPDGGHVSLDAERHGDALTVRVSDTGVGIPEAEQQHLFARFNRASTATGPQTPGTGLGLTIARTIVEQHGGAITLESVLGAGTTVTVSLPTAPPSSAVAPPVLAGSRTGRSTGTV